MIERPISDAGRRETLYKLYRRNVGRGNFQPDVAARGGNEVIKEALLALGLEPNEAAVERRFKVMDEQEWDRQEERLQRLNRERAA